ncbi:MULTISPECIES: hypothetical protein [Paenibacillus]|uniref:hypothetical protein n=1 Tax=Paenibacillus TaxID=44249 RepID=UPI000386B845|nr:MULTISPECIES: hypothetical protein [Paenibacillus]EPY09633.1 hypothetical protein PAAL66ix_26633 [Paenibacillus alvei A6-6i-x]
MKMKEIALSVIIYAFLGYLWVLFSERMVSIANAMGNMLIGGLLLSVGTLLFFAIVNRIAPFHNYKLTHPTRLAGAASFLIVVLSILFV